MAKTYCTCIGSRNERTARGGKNGCRASVQSWDGSICISNWYDDNDNLRVRVGTSEGSHCYSGYEVPDFVGSFEEFKELLQLRADIKSGKVSVVRHREKSNKMKQLERMFMEAN